MHPVRPNLKRKVGRLKPLQVCPCSRNTSQLVSSLWECVKPISRSSRMVLALRKASTYAWRHPLDKFGPLPWMTLSLCTVMSPLAIGTCSTTSSSLSTVCSACDSSRDAPTACMHSSSRSVPDISSDNGSGRSLYGETDPICVECCKPVPDSSSHSTENLSNLSSHSQSTLQNSRYIATQSMMRSESPLTSLKLSFPFSSHDAHACKAE